MDVEGPGNALIDFPSRTSSRASSNWSRRIFFGRPKVTPRAFAATLPSFVRLIMRVRSNSALCNAPHRRNLRATSSASGPWPASPRRALVDAVRAQVRAHQKPDPPRPVRNGQSRHSRGAAMPGARYQPRHSISLCRSGRRAPRPRPQGIGVLRASQGATEILCRVTYLCRD